MQRAGPSSSSRISISLTVSRTMVLEGNKCLTFWRWRMSSFIGLSAQPDPTALQRSNRGKCAHLLHDLDATADFSLHCQLFALQLLDLTHRWSSESEGPDIEEEMSTPLRHRLMFALNCTPPGTQTLLHSSFRTLDGQLSH